MRGKQRGELPATPPAGRHTASSVRFATDRAVRGEAPGRGGAVAAGGTPNRPGVVIIARPSDLLAQLVATSLIYAHVPTCQLDPTELADVELQWRGSTVTLNGQPVGGLLWRTLECPASSHSASSSSPDGGDPMITASWLAAASFPSMRAVNAYDAEAWRRGAGWSVWEDRLSERGVPVQPREEPHPTSPGTASLVVCGRIVSGPATESVSAAAEALETSGVRLARVTVMPNGRVSGVDTQPRVADSVEARRAAARIADYLAA